MGNPPLTSGNPDGFWWHIHVDGSQVGEDFRKFLAERGFHPDDFIHSSGQYAPVQHLTWKGKRNAVNEYKEHMQALRAFLGNHGFAPDVESGYPDHVYGKGDPKVFRGYVEAEHIARDVDLAEMPFDETLAAPFRLQMRDLLAGFRESEVHVAMDVDRSDKRLMEAIRSMGLYDVLMPKPKDKRMTVIFTAQAATQEEIAEIIPPLETYLHAAGGAVRGSVKEERITDWVSSHRDVKIPPVIDWSRSEGLPNKQI